MSTAEMNTPLKTIPLGNTGLTVTKPAMGCLPLQRCSVEDAVRLLQAAYEGGIRYFDTANALPTAKRKSVLPFRMYAKTSCYPQSHMHRIKPVFWHTLRTA